MHKTVILFIVLLSLTACSSANFAPVVSRVKSPKMTGYIVVRQNETLFQIAKRFGHDYQNLAQINHISYPYHIYPGQKIHFSSKKENNKNIQLIHHPLKTKKQNESKTFASIHNNIESNNKPGLNNLKSKEKIEKNRQKASTEREVNTLKWHWPIHGKVVRHFAEVKSSKGIDIIGKPGLKVKAAAPGIVVYSGNALKGYGNLIIIKHNEDFLSAYAHNEKLMVKEGERVTFGQAIATMGRSGTSQEKLHFEIRYRGMPVDPLKFLPKI